LVDNYIKLEFSDDEAEQPYEINHHLILPIPVLPQVAKVQNMNSKPLMQFKQLVTQKDEQKIWSVRHLSKNGETA
jgi:hypothetical protein